MVLVAAAAAAAAEKALDSMGEGVAAVTGRVGMGAGRMETVAVVAMALGG